MGVNGLFHSVEQVSFVKVLCPQRLSWNISSSRCLTAGRDWLCTADRGIIGIDFADYPEHPENR